jgi:hypothetical protein
MEAAGQMFQWWFGEDSLVTGWPFILSPWSLCTPRRTQSAMVGVVSTVILFRWAHAGVNVVASLSREDRSGRLMRAAFTLVRSPGIRSPLDRHLQTALCGGVEWASRLESRCVSGRL